MDELTKKISELKFNKKSNIQKIQVDDRLKKLLVITGEITKVELYMKMNQYLLENDLYTQNKEIHLDVKLSKLFGVGRRKKLNHIQIYEYLNILVQK